MTPLRIAVQMFWYPLEVFFTLLSRTNTLSFFYVMFTVAVVYRLLIAPIIGNSLRDASSDTARSRNQRNRSKDQHGKG